MGSNLDAAQRPQALWRLLALGAAIAAALAAQGLVTSVDRQILGWLLFTSAAVVAALAAWQSWAQPDDLATSPSRTVPWPVRLAAAGIAAACTLACTLLATTDAHPILTLVLWLTAFLPATVAVWRLQAAPPGRARVHWPLGEVIVLVLLVLLGAVARYSWIGTLPPYLFHDEPLVAVHLLRNFRDGQVPNFFIMGWNSWSNIGLAVQGILVPWFGLHTTTLRMASALMGTLAVATTYLLGRELFNQRVAFLAALFFAVGRTGLEFSRLGVCHAQVLFLTTFAFYWWWHAVNYGRASSYLWCGIGLGLCLYTYNAAHAMPLLWLGWVVACAVVKPRRIATHWRGALITVAGFVVATLPWLYFVTDHFTFQRMWLEWTWMARHRQVVSQITDLWNAQGATPALTLLFEQVRKTWLGFNVIPAGAYGVGYRGGGMLDHVSAALFILGLGIATTRLLRRDFFLIWWWLPTVIFGGVLTADPPATVRLVGILPALALLAALPLDALWRACESRRLLRPVAAVATALLLAGSMWDNWRTYFVQFAAIPLDETSDAIRHLERLPKDTTALSIGAEHWLWLNREVAAVNFAGQRVDDIEQTSDFFPVHEPITTPLALVLGPTQTSLAPYIRRLYPSTRVEDNYEATDSHRLRFSLIQLDPHELEARTGLHLDGATGDGGAPIDPFAALPDSAHSGPRLRWTGALYWPTDQPATLRLSNPAPTTVRLGSRPPLQSRDGESNANVFELPRGWLPVVIEENANARRELMLEIEYGGKKRRLTRWDLRPDGDAQGVSAVYERDGKTLLRATEPQVNTFAVEEIFRHHDKLTLAMPFVASWKGTLRIDTPGSYTFEGIGSGPFSIQLDGIPVCAVDTVEQPEQPKNCSSTRDLSAGTHRFEAHFDSMHPAGNGRRVFQVYWTPPGGERELIPPTQFAPLS